MSHTTSLSTKSPAIGQNSKGNSVESETISPTERRSQRKAEREKANTGANVPVQERDDIEWVDWAGPNDPKNPKNWTYREKWVITMVVSAFTFISPVASSMVAPASAQIAIKFGITSTVLSAMTISIFILGYAVGPLFLGPLSEIFGRSKVLQLSNLFFLAWNLGCGFAQNKNQLIIFRLLSGIGGSAPLSIGGGFLGDVWSPEQRGKAIAIFSLAPLMGPVVGPVCGGWIAERSTWRWVFWSTSIADALIQLLGLFLIRETFAPVLLEKKAHQIRNKHGSGEGENRSVLTVYESDKKRTWQHLFKVSLVRPFQLFRHEAIIQLLGIYMAFVYGIFYLFLTNIPAIFEKEYHEDTGIAGLNYIALGVGLTLASQCNARFMDKIYVHLKKKYGGPGQPEYRLPSMFPATIMLPFGLFLTGWSAENRLHWIATDIGITFVGASVVLIFQSIQTYVVDAFTLYAASALAAVSCLRSLAGFGFPLFAPAMYNKLGYGKGDTVLACLAIGLGCPAPILLWKYGKRIRMSSKYAHKGDPEHVLETNDTTNNEFPCGIIHDQVHQHELPSLQSNSDKREMEREPTLRKNTANDINV